MAKRKVEHTFHDIAKSFPRLEGDQRESLRQSIKQFGVINPIVLWLNDQGEQVTIDGRNRREIVEELVAEGVTEADNGVPMRCQEFVYKGSERGALDFARAMNLQRRHLTSSQRAAIAVLHGDMAGKYDETYACDYGSDVTLEQIAKEAGTSRTYLSSCVKLFREKPELLYEVAAGHKKIPQALKELRQDDAPDEPAEPKDETPPEILDGLKQPVPPEFAAIFATRDEFRAASRQLKGIANAVEGLAEGPGGKHVPIQLIVKDFKNLSRAIMDSAPHVICPHCSGTGNAGDPDHPKKKCGACKGTAYLDRLQWKMVPDHLKATVPGAAMAEAE